MEGTHQFFLFAFVLCLCLYLHLCLGLFLWGLEPNVTCLVINLESIRCMWNLKGTPQVNYTFYSRFVSSGNSICAKYLTENGRNIGCTLPYIREQRFESFYTELRDGSKTYEKEHDLKTKVKLNPPTNLTVKNASDLNLWFYWNNTVNLSCVESRVRIRKNDNNWEQHYCQNLPSSTARYELQVKSRLDENCGESEFWSDWSESVVWGFNNTTGKAMPVWTALLYVVSAITLLLLVVILLHNERSLPINKQCPLRGLLKYILILLFDIRIWLI
uniref:Cytokine receptor-like factor 2-like D1 domain-containing protein n=1 Tax=Poecilia latipinna TaxID=48699 RepID=A0A3B3TSW7_9TELE